MRVLRNFNGCNCSVMAIWFFVASNWFNFEVCRTSYKHRWGVTLCSPAAAKFALHFLPIVFQPREVFCPAPDKISFSAASPSSLPFLFELEEFAEWEFEPEGTKKALISIEYHPSANNMAGTLICHWSAWWEDLDPVSLAECGLAMKLFTFIRVKDYRLLDFFFLHVKHCVTIFAALNLSFAVDTNLPP